MEEVISALSVAGQTGAYRDCTEHQAARSDPRRALAGPADRHEEEQGVGGDAPSDRSRRKRRRKCSALLAAVSRLSVHTPALPSSRGVADRSARPLHRPCHEESPVPSINRPLSALMTSGTALLSSILRFGRAPTGRPEDEEGARNPAPKEGGPRFKEPVASPSLRA
jgi:hypothetical protein